MGNAKKENDIISKVIMHNEEIYKISTNLDYLNWLKTFTIKYPTFCMEDWKSEKEELTEEDYANVRRLSYLYEAIEEYATETYRDGHLINSGYYYVVNADEESFDIGFIAGQGTIFFCQRKNELTEGIDFNDVVKYHQKRKTKIRKRTI